MLVARDFSGQEIQIAGQKLTVLSDARRRNHFDGQSICLVEHRANCRAKQLKISAKHLNSVSM